MTGLQGVGLSYHPLLHEAVLGGRFAVDFAEIGIDAYVDSARFPLLDPEEERLRAIVAKGPCIWRGSALSLGSVETLDDAAPDGYRIERVRQFLDESGAGGYCETIGFRRLAERDIGAAQALPYRRIAAQWVAARFKAASDALGRELFLQLPATPLRPPPGDDDAFGFLRSIAELARCRFVLDIADLARFASEAGIAQDEIASRLPVGRIAAFVICGDGEEEWRLLASLTGALGAEAIIVRRERNLFPLDAIAAATSRAGELLRKKRRRAAAPTLPTSPPAALDRRELEALRAYQERFLACCLDAAQAASIPDFASDQPSEWTALARRAQSWQSWRERLADMHKARQIRQFLAGP
jgi:uncharacterized protein (UPF0276 family)